jgi:SAM-dependent methyltransferase
MDWIVPFYGFKSAQLGPTGIFDSHRRRAAQVARLAGAGPRRVLELGAGAGGTAAALADLGHEVVAVELTPIRARFARELAAEPHAGRLAVVEADYFAVQLDGRFDVVGHWDSFGMGTDADQRRLLRRVASDWLAPGGCALFDVFNPFWWAHHSGEVLEHRDWGLMQRRGFDPVASRFLDAWWPIGDEDRALAQSVRCYTPADLPLLLEGTGLALRRIEIKGEQVDAETAAGRMIHWQAEIESYLVQLVHDGASLPPGSS